MDIAIDNLAVSNRCRGVVRAAIKDVNLSVKALVRDCAGRLLLLKDARSEWWDLPGGHVHSGETLPDALERELSEETGLHLLSFKDFGVSDLILGGERRTVAFYEVQCEGDIKLSDEHESLLWVTPNEIGDYDLGAFRSAVESFLDGGQRVKAALQKLKSLVRAEKLARRVDGVIHARTQETVVDPKERVRAEAERTMREAVRDALALATADALARKVGSKKRDEELEAAMLLLLVVGVGTAYSQSAPKLATIARGADHSDVTTAEEEAEHITTRAPLLKDFVGNAVKQVRAEAEESRKQGDKPHDTAKRVKAKAKEVEGGHGKTVADTEAAAAASAGQLRALVRAGYTHAYWVTVGDDKVRPSHVECEEAGAVKIGKPFPNGLLFPHEPGAPAEETINCRCWLEGARKAEKISASAFDEQKVLGNTPIIALQSYINPFVFEAIKP